MSNKLQDGKAQGKSELSDKDLNQVAGGTVFRVDPAKDPAVVLKPITATEPKTGTGGTKRGTT